MSSASRRSSSASASSSSYYAASSSSSSAASSVRLLPSPHTPRVRGAPDAVALLNSARARAEPEYARAVLHAYAGAKLARGRPRVKVNAKLLSLERQYPAYAPDFAAVRLALDLPLCMILGPHTPGYDADNPFHYAHRGRVLPPPAYDGPPAYGGDGDAPAYAP